MDNCKKELAKILGFSTPPAGMSMFLTLGGHVDDWIKLATLIYIVVQLAALVVSKYLLWTGRLRRRKGEDDE